MPAGLLRIVFALVLGSGAFAVSARTAPPAAAAPDGIADQVVLGGLTLPTRVAFAADGQVFVAEKSGRILRLASVGQTTPTVVADLREQVFDFWDRGLLGLAVDPAFTRGRPFLYALFSHDALPGGTAPRWNDDCPKPMATETGCVVTGRLVRLRIGPSGTAVATTVLVDDWCQQFPSHSVGDLRFGPDGALYATAGDGASFQFVDHGQVGNPCGDPAFEGGALRSLDPLTRSDPQGLDGTLIRIDPDTGAARADNPWAGSTDANRARTVAFGMRNPWRFTFRPGTSEAWVADVGWGGYEEINRIVLGTGAIANLGWPCFEGPDRQPSYAAAGLAMCDRLQPHAVTAPYYAYGRTGIGGTACGAKSQSVSALAFATNPRYPAAYRGALFFSDYARKCVFTMRAGPGGLPDRTTIAPFLVGRPVVDLQAGPGRDLFYLDIGAGELRRLVASGTNRAPVADIRADRTAGPAPLTVTFDAGGSTDPDPDDVLTFAWDLDDDGQFDDAAGPTASTTYAAPRTFAARVRATDSYGLHATASVTISVANDRPEPTIATPSAALRWSAGDTVTFSGSAQDRQDGTLPRSALTWRLAIQHCGEGGTECHEHLVRTWTGVAEGSFTAPEHEWPSYLELTLTASDRNGASTTVSRRLDPRTVALGVTSDPPGIAITAANTTGPTPFTRTVIAGTDITVSAPATAVVNGITWTFASWSNGRTRSHDLTPTTDTTLTATYNRQPGLTLDTWTSWGGSLLTDIPTGTPPNATTTINASAAPRNRGNDYGQRLRGLLTPTITGTYRLYLASDDEGILALNPNGADPNGRRTIARVTDWTDHNNFTQQPGQRSAEFTLRAGTSYWIEAFAKDAGNLDHLSIAWTGPGITTPTPIPANRLTPTTNGCTGWCPPSGP